MKPATPSKNTPRSAAFEAPSTSQGKLFAENPFARLLMIAACAQELEAADIHDPAVERDAVQFWARQQRTERATTSLAPLWAERGERQGVAECALACWGGGNSRQSRQRYGLEIPAMGPRGRSTLESWRLLAKSSGDLKLSDDLAKTLALFNRQDRHLSGEESLGLGDSIGRALALYIDAQARAEAKPGRIEEMLARGRAHLGGQFGLNPEALDALEADPQLCKALGRLCFFGATDPALVPAMLRRLSSDAALREHHFNPLAFTPAGIEAPSPWIDQELERRAMARSSSSYDLPALLPTAEGAEPTPALRLAAFCSGERRAEALPSSALPMAHLRMALFALQAPEPHRSVAREALLRGTSTPSDLGAPEPWSHIHPLGDLPSEAMGLHGKRLIGAGARGESLREALRDYYAIFQWRNPSLLLASAQGPIGERALKSASEEASAFSSKASMALCAAMDQATKSPAQRRALATALAQRAAQGFSSLGPEPDLDDLLPGYEPPLGGAPGAAFFAGARGADPMAKVAASAAKLHGLLAPDATGLVGEAKRVLADKHGLSGAAWKSMAANPELRDLFAAACARSIQALGASAKARPAYGGIQKLADEIMRMADATGSSARARMDRLIAREGSELHIESFARALSAGSALGFGAAEQAESLRLLEMPAAGPLRALLCGFLPSAPKEAAKASDSLLLGAEIFPLLLEDAASIGALAPALLKGVMSKHARHLRGREPAAARALTLGLVDDIADLAKNMPGGFWARLDPKDPVNHALRMHQEWVEQLGAASVDGNPSMSLKWTPLVGADTQGRATAVELLSGRELHEEGSAMHHCVASYASNCLQGRSRVVSLRLDGARASTLELAPADARGARLGIDFADIEARRKVKSWTIVQHRGKCNAAVTHPELLAFANTVSERATSGFHATTEKLAKKAAAEALAAQEARRANPKM